MYLIWILAGECGEGGRRGTLMNLSRKVLLALKLNFMQIAFHRPQSQQEGSSEKLKLLKSPPQRDWKFSRCPFPDSLDVIKLTWELRGRRGDNGF